MSQSDIPQAAPALMACLDCAHIIDTGWGPCVCGATRSHDVFGPLFGRWSVYADAVCRPCEAVNTDGACALFERAGQG